MPAEKPLVYLILGASGSGRRTVVADLIDGGLAETDRAVVLLSNAEKPSEIDTRLANVQRWTFENGMIAAPDEVLQDATHCFFLVDGAANPIDQIEAFKPWMVAQGAEIGSVICVVNCKLAEAHRELIAWYEACIFFSDIVVLANREGVANKWLSDFQARFKDQFYPCLFEFLKHGMIKNPALYLDPVPRRMSHFFDEQEWQIDGVDVDDDIESGEGDDEEPSDMDDEVEVKPAEDPYMERRAGGRRLKEIPDIGRILSASAGKDQAKA